MTRLYELLIPLISSDPAEKWPKIQPRQFHHRQTITANQDPKPTFVLTPESGEIYLVYSMTVGWPRNVSDDAEIMPTESVYFEHWQEPYLPRHTNYMLHSYADHPEECWLEVEEASPLNYEFTNELTVSIYMDVTVWCFEVKQGQWLLVREFLQRALKRE